MSALRQRCPLLNLPPAPGMELQLPSSPPVEGDWQREAEFRQANYLSGRALASGGSELFPLPTPWFLWGQRL